MGLNTEHILSDERHYNPFICAICTNLVELNDVLVTTKCSHAFCRHCIETWLGMDSNQENSFHRSDRLRCPTCNRSLERRSDDGAYDAGIIVTQIAALQTMKVAQPLAYRVLSRVHVSCPLADIGCCQWKGDYADLQQHLLSDTQHIKCNAPQNRPIGQEEDDIASSVDDSFRVMKMVTSYKEEANSKFSADNFQDALELYSKAISYVPSLNGGDTKMIATLYANRAVTYLKLKRYELCISDCNEAIKLDATYIKAYIRRAKAQIDLGKFDDAFNHLYQGVTLNKDSHVLNEELKRIKYIRDQMRLGLSHIEQNEFIPAARILGTLLQKTNSLPVVIAAARAEIGLGFTDRAMRLTLQIIRADKYCAEGYELRALCYFMNGELSESIALYREALRLDPDSPRAKRDMKTCLYVKNTFEDINKLIFHRKFLEAIEKLSLLLKQLKSVPSNSFLMCNFHTKLAEACLRTKQFELALKHANIALYGRNDLESAWVIKIQAYRGMGKEETALEELTEIMNTWGASSEAMRTAYNKTEFDLRKKKRPDYYQLFNVPSVASQMEIKRQYKMRAKDLHPDKFSGSNYTEADRKVAEEKFKLLGEGLEILCDDFKRQLYDEGYDKEAIQERVNAAQQAAHHPRHGYHH